MDVKFARRTLPRSGTVVVFAGEGPEYFEAAQDIDLSSGAQLARAGKIAEFDGKAEQIVELIAPHGAGFDRVFVTGLGAPRKMTAYEAEKLGGAIASSLLAAKVEDVHIIIDKIDGLDLALAEFTARLGVGLRLAAYRFDKYKSKKKNGKKSLKTVTMHCPNTAATAKLFDMHEAVTKGVLTARDLVNEPANELYPESFAARAKQLAKLGLQIEVMGEKQLEKAGFRALLAVGRGSARESQVVIMRWKGAKQNVEPVAFLGKGVTFDTGGISIKPSAGMEDMKGDMGGAACVTGLMEALARRKAKVNAIGVIGLVENMPSSSAQRPGDIVKSLSGQTIEVLNTDAEGRLVLADLLWYVQEKYQPKFMIDLATLTGAIIVSLGQEHAGLFTNSDMLAERLASAGEATGETVWRMPLGKGYDKMIDGKTGDIKNIGGRHAGSVTAAQFLQRFVNDLPWAHLDIAGTAMNAPKTKLNHSWGSGWGVRLLNQLVEEHYEK